jgi:hypothetical protein
MHWYLVHTKPRRERCALENLQRQGYLGEDDIVRFEDNYGR